MHFIIEPKQFKNLVQTVSPASDRKGAFAGLGYIKIEAVDDRVVFSATNLESSVKSYRKADVKEPGIVCLSGNSLSTIAPSLDGDFVSIVKIGENQAEIKCGNAKLHLNLLDPESFPDNIPHYGDMKFTPVDVNFLKIMDKVNFASSSDESRAHLCGVFMQANEMVATDGHRMAVYNFKTPTEVGVIVPSAISTMAKALTHSDNDKQLSVCVDENSIHFHKGDTAASIRLLQGSYPNYTQLIPKDNNNTITTDKAAFKSALKMVMLISDNMNKIVISTMEGKMKMYSKSAEVGDVEDIIDCEGPESFEVAINGKYLLDAIDRLEGDKVVMKVGDSSKPVLIKEEGYLHVIMPQRI